MLERDNPERVTFIVNPNGGEKAGRKERLKLVNDVAKGLQAGGWLIDICYTEHAGDETVLTEKSIEKGATIIAMATGDGGLNKGAKGVLNAEKRKREKGEALVTALDNGPEKRIAIATVQIGTVNNYDHDLHASKRAAEIVLAMQNGVRKGMDFGEIEDSSGNKDIHLGVADAGYLAHAMSMVHAYGEEKTSDGKWPFFKAGLRDLGSYREVSGEIIIGRRGKPKPIRFLEVIYSNSQWHVCGRLHPRAKVNDGWQNMTLIEGDEGWEIFPRGLLTFALRGRKNPLVAMSGRIRQTVINLAEPVAFEQDGEPRGTTSFIKTTTIPLGITAFVPAYKGITIFRQLERAA